MRTHPATFLVLVLGLIWLPRGTFGAEQAEAVLPAGVKAVWDLDKAFREKSPTRERVCLNGLWRWQPGPSAKPPFLQALGASLRFPAHGRDRTNSIAKNRRPLTPTQVGRSRT